MPAQPTQEMFENKLATELYAKAKIDAPIIVEDESQRIGQINMPNSFFENFKQGPILFLDIPSEERLNYILKMYGHFEVEDLMHGVFRIRKRLGGLDAKNAIQCLLEQDKKGCFRILLSYYDKYYKKGSVQLESSITFLSLPNINQHQNANTILEWKATQRQHYA